MLDEVKTTVGDSELNFKPTNPVFRGLRTVVLKWSGTPLSVTVANGRQNDPRLSRDGSDHDGRSNSSQLATSLI